MEYDLANVHTTRGDCWNDWEGQVQGEDASSFTLSCRTCGGGDGENAWELLLCGLQYHDTNGQW